MKLKVGDELISNRQWHYAVYDDNGNSGQQWLNAGEIIVLVEEGEKGYMFSRPEWKVKHGTEENLYIEKRYFASSYASDAFREVHPSVHLCDY